MPPSVRTFLTWFSSEDNWALWSCVWRSLRAEEVVHDDDGIVDDGWHWGWACLGGSGFWGGGRTGWRAEDWKARSISLLAHQ